MIIYYYITIVLYNVIIIITTVLYKFLNFFIGINTVNEFLEYFDRLNFVKLNIHKKYLIRHFGIMRTLLYVVTFVYTQTDVSLNVNSCLHK